MPVIAGARGESGKQCSICFSSEILVCDHILKSLSQMKLSSIVVLIILSVGFFTDCVPLAEAKSTKGRNRKRKKGGRNSSSDDGGFQQIYDSPMEAFLGQLAATATGDPAKILANIATDAEFKIFLGQSEDPSVDSQLFELRGPEGFFEFLDVVGSVVDPALILDLSTDLVLESIDTDNVRNIMRVKSCLECGLVHFMNIITYNEKYQLSAANLYLSVAAV